MYDASLLPAWLTSGMDGSVIFQSRDGKNDRRLFVEVQALQCTAETKL